MVMPIGKEPPFSTFEIAAIYRDLRTQILTLDAKKAGLVPEPTTGIWGILMETGYAKAIETLVALTGGTASLYFSDGGGIISAEQHDGPRKACDALIALAPRFLEQFKPTPAFPLPDQGRIIFYLLTQDGVCTAAASEDDLARDRSPLSPLFHQAQAVITQIRRVEEGMQKELDK